MSDGPIKILIQDGSGVRPVEEGFADEKELQTFLRDYATLIPLDELGPSSPPLLCIGFEVNVSSGTQDLLYVDTLGRLTIIEAKLKKNPEVRREVVGQILEYAADAVLWSQSDIEERAARFFSGTNCPSEYRDLNLRQALEHFVRVSGSLASDDFDYEAFLDSIRVSLERGNIRLIIAVDEIHPALLRTVEFVNRFSERFEIYLFQLKRFHDASTGANIFVPALFGRVADIASSRKRPHLWDRDGFLQQVSEHRQDLTELFDTLITLAEEHGAISWGRGATIATFGFRIPGKDGEPAPVFGGSGYGKAVFDFKTLADRLDDELMASYRSDLRGVSGIPGDVLASESWREIDAAFLIDQDALSAFVAAVLNLQRAAAQRYSRP